MARGEIKRAFWPMVGRALLARCPRCGGQGWMRGLWRRDDRCRTCGYRYERQPGFILGALTINIIVTFGLLAVALVVGIVASWPDLAVAPLLIVGFAICGLVPLLFNPFSHMLWAAVDLTMHPLDEAEVADAAAHAAGAVGLS